MSPIIVIIIVVITAAVAAGTGYMIRKQTAERKIGSAEEAAKTILAEADKQAQAVKREKIIEAKEEVHKLRKDLEQESHTKTFCLKLYLFYGVMSRQTENSSLTALRAANPVKPRFVSFLTIFCGHVSPRRLRPSTSRQASSISRSGG